MQVVHGQGDGYIRGYEAKTGKKLWEFDSNPKDSVWPKTRNEVIRRPGHRRQRRVHRERAGPGTRRRHGPSLRDSRDEARRHHADRPHLALRQNSPLDLDAALKDGSSITREFQPLPALPRRQTGKPVWSHDMLAAMWTAVVADGRSAGCSDRTATSSVPGWTREELLHENNMDSAVYASVVTANGVMYVMTRNNLYAIQEGAQLKR